MLIEIFFVETFRPDQRLYVLLKRATTKAFLKKVGSLTVNKGVSLGTTVVRELTQAKKIRMCDVIDLAIYLHCGVIKASLGKPGLFTFSQVSNLYLLTLFTTTQLLFWRYTIAPKGHVVQP